MRVGRNIYQKGLKYQVIITESKQSVFVGSYDSISEASNARDIYKANYTTSYHKPKVLPTKKPRNSMLDIEVDDEYAQKAKEVLHRLSQHKYAVKRPARV